MLHGTRVRLRSDGDERKYMRHDDIAYHFRGARRGISGRESLQTFGLVSLILQVFVCNRRPNLVHRTSHGLSRDAAWTTLSFATFMARKCGRSIALARVRCSLQAPPWFPPSHPDAKLPPHPAMNRCRIACGHFAVHHRRRLDPAGRGGACCKHLAVAY